MTVMKFQCVSLYKMTFECTRPDCSSAQLTPRFSQSICKYAKLVNTFIHINYIVEEMYLLMNHWEIAYK